MARAPMDESRKWGIYNTTNLLFKTYFRVWPIGSLLLMLRPNSDCIAKSSWPLEKPPSGYWRVLRRPTIVGRVSEISHCHIQVLCWSHLFLGRELYRSRWYLYCCQTWWRLILLWRSTGRRTFDSGFSNVSQRCLQKSGVCNDLCI